MPDTPNTAQLYQQLLHTLGATDQASAMRELARLHALDLAATTEQSSAVARSGAVPAAVCIVGEPGDFAPMRVERVAAPEPPQVNTASDTPRSGNAPVAYQLRCNGSRWSECGRETFERGRCDVAGHVCEVRALYTAPPADAPTFPAGLHPRTADLVRRFSVAMAEKLFAAQEKYGYSDGWADPGWMDECRAHLLQHVAKGDPRDVGNYAAFLWHHGASTAGAPADAPRGEVAAWHTDDGRTISAKQKSDALRDGGASASSVASYTRPSYFGAATADARDGAWARAYEFVTSILPLDPERKHWVRDPTNPMGLAEQDRHRVDLLVASRDANAEDARRYRYATADLSGDARVRRNEILDRLPVMSKSAADAAIDSAMGAGGVQHGVNCPKVIHKARGGYLHAADDDTPYDVDGCTYCGRCHYALDSAPGATGDES